MHKKILVLFTLLFLSFAAPSNAASQTSFKDLTPTHWAYEEISSLVTEGVLGGYEDGTVRPDHPVSREELAKITFTLFPAAKSNLLETDATRPDYPDIYDRWGTPYLETAAFLVPGYTDGHFKPSEPATRRDVAILLLYGKLMQSGLYQFKSGELSILIPLPQKEIWNQLQQFKEYSTLKEDYSNSSRYIEDDPQNKQFSRYAGQFYSQLNNIAFLVDQNILNGYTDKTLRLEQKVTRAETCVLAKRLSNMDLAGWENFLLETPALNKAPHTISLKTDNPHSVMVSLGQWYKAKYPHEKQRAKAIYDWLIFNFTYDWDYRTGISDLPSTNLQSTLTTGTGIYVNFTNLYAILNKYAGIKAYVISGKSTNPTDTGPHAWVELILDGSSTFVDPTYGICTGKDYFGNFSYWEERGHQWEEEKRREL